MNGVLEQQPVALNLGQPLLAVYSGWEIHGRKGKESEVVVSCPI